MGMFFFLNECDTCSYIMSYHVFVQTGKVFPAPEAFILTAVVVIPLILKQEMFGCSCNYTSSCKIRCIHSNMEK